MIALEIRTSTETKKGHIMRGMLIVHFERKNGEEIVTQVIKVYGGSAAIPAEGDELTYALEEVVRGGWLLQYERPGITAKETRIFGFVLL